MPAADQAIAPSSNLPPWLVLEGLSPFDAYAQAVGTVMLIIALLQWLCSRYTDARALRIFALLYLLTGIGWMTAHPRAHGGPSDVPLLPVLVAVGLLAMNVWGMYEYLGLARRRAWALVGGALAVGAGLVLWLQMVSRSANVVYAAMAAAFAYCAWLAVRAARHEDNVGHLYIAAAFAAYPLLFLIYLALPDSMAGFEIGYFASVPVMVVGMMILAVSLIRARRRSADELVRRVAAEADLRQLNATLEERVAARTRELHDLVAGLESFNRNVSHDLRDPLAGLSGLAQLGTLALERGDTPKLRSHLALIQAQAKHMTGMVQGLLQLSRATDVPLRRERHDLRHCVERALGQLRLQAPMAEAMRQVNVRLQDLPACEIDSDLMRQVFINLVGNALKFTAPRGADGQVSVGLRASRHGLAVCVDDNGIGLPAGREADLFKPFARLHGDQVPGSGVGLTIVRRIVEAHGGRIWAERSAEGGTCFLFTIGGLA